MLWSAAVAGSHVVGLAIEVVVGAFVVVPMAVVVMVGLLQVIVLGIMALGATPARTCPCYQFRHAELQDHVAATYGRSVAP